MTNGADRAAGKKVQSRSISFPRRHSHSPKCPLVTNAWIEPSMESLTCGRDVFILLPSQVHNQIKCEEPLFQTIEYLLQRISGYVGEVNELMKGPVWTQSKTIRDCDNGIDHGT